MKTIELAYKPTEKQKLYHASIADIELYGGAAGGGKSRATVEDAFNVCLLTGGVHTYLFRKTYPELKDTLIKEAQLAIPKELGKYNSQFHDYVIRSADGGISYMHFRYCRNLQDAYRYQGAEMHKLYIDELTHFPKEVFDYLRTRVRVPTVIANKGIYPQVKCTSNPGGVGHGWVKDMFIDNKDPFTYHKQKVYSQILQREKTILTRYVPAYVTDNPFLTDNYIFELEQKPERLRKALLEGLWDSFEGQAFPEFVDNHKHYDDRLWTHVIKPFKIPKEWKRFKTFDMGYSRPFSVGWWAVDHDGRLYRYRELYGCTGEPNVGVKWHVPKIAEKIKEIERELEGNNFIHGYADPAIWGAAQEQNGESIAETFERYGVYWEKGNNNRLQGKLQLHYRFAFDVEGRPMLYSFSTCKGFNRTIPTLVQDLVNVEDIDTGGEDHIYDETRFICMANPLAPRASVRVPNAPHDPLKINEKQWDPYGFIRM